MGPSCELTSKPKNWKPTSEPGKWWPTFELFTVLVLTLWFNSTDAGGSDGVAFLPRRALRLDAAPFLLPPAGTAIARNGRELVAALGNRTVTVIQLMSPIISVAAEDWKSSSVGLPIVLERNVSVDGQTTVWPQLILASFKDAVELKGTVRVTFRYVYLYADSLLGNTNRLAGTELFTPTDADGAPGEVWVTTAAFYTPYCFPGFLHTMDIKQMPRPVQYPGNQSAIVDAVQDGCINATDAPPLLRCWADKVYILDMALVGNDIDPNTGVTISRNLLFRFFNTTAVCETYVDLGCLAQQKDPLLCYTETVTRSGGISGISGSGLAAGAAGGASGDAASQRTAEAGAARIGGGRNRTAVVVGPTVGAVAGLVLLLGAIAAAVMLLVVMRRRRRHRLSGTCFNTYLEIASSEKMMAAKAAASAVADESPAGASINADMAAAAETITTADHPDKAKAAVVTRPAAADVAPPVTPWTRPSSNIHLHVMLVQLQQRPAGYSSSSLQAAPPQLRIPPAGVAAAITEAAIAAAGAGPLVAQNGDQHPAAVTVAAAGLRTIDEEAMEATLGSGGGGDGGGGGGGGGDAAGAPAGGVGGQHQHQPDTQASASAMCTDAPPANYSFAGDSTSESDFLHSNESSGEGCGVVGLLPVVLGKGSFGRVVEGLYLGRRVAVKIMVTDYPFSCCNGEAAAADPYGSFAAAFAREVEVLARCQHPNVVSLLAACVTPPRFCLVMELMDTSLERLIHHQEVMPLPKVLYIGICIANALAYMHPTITHRDVKPANVLVNNPQSNWPTAKLTDFGLSRLRVTVASTEHPDAGTPAYMAPECFDVTNGRITHQADIYSLGVLLWEMLSVTKPWKDVGAVAVAFMVAYKGMRLPLASLPSSRCPHKLSRLLQSCWDDDPARRPAAAEVAKILTLVLQDVEQQDLSRSTAAPSGGQQ